MSAMGGTVPSINDDAVAELRSWLGRPRPARGWNSTVTADAVWHFAAGVGDDNPLWWDADHCARSPHGAMFAPPTFLYSCNNAPELPGEKRLHPSEHWLPGSRTMWISDRWQFFRRAWVGEDVTAVEELVDVVESTSRSGRPVVTHTDRTTFRGGDGTVIAHCDKTVLRSERGAPSAAAEVPDAAYTAEEAAAFADHYRLEPASRRGPMALHAPALTLGASTGTLLKGPLTQTTVIGWVLGWGSPMCLTNRMQSTYLAEHPGSRLVDESTNIEDSLESTHWDSTMARLVGLPRAYDLGPQRISWVAHLITDWMGDLAFLAELEVRLTRPNLLGDVTWLSGTVTGVEPASTGGTAVTVAVIGRNQRDERTVEATARVLTQDPAYGEEAR